MMSWCIPFSYISFLSCPLSSLLFLPQPSSSDVSSLYLSSSLRPLLQDEKTIDAKALVQKYLRKLTVDNVSEVLLSVFIFVFVWSVCVGSSS